MNISNWADDFLNRDEIIRKLIEENNQLKQRIEQLEKKQYNDYQPLLTTKQVQNIYQANIVKHMEQPFITQIPTEKGFKLYTITFSPERFNRHTDEQYISYIYYHLLQIFYSYNTYMYGCIEHHETGVVHAHVLIQSLNSHGFVRMYLNDHFNHSIKNKYCIRVDDIKSGTINKVVEYINKDCKYGFPKYYYELRNNHHHQSLFQQEASPDRFKEWCYKEEEAWRIKQLEAKKKMEEVRRIHQMEADNRREPTSNYLF